MERHDNQFHPESVDEEIDQLLQAHDQAETRAHPRAHFVHEMSDLYLEESRVLDRAWKRLSQHVQPAEQTTSIEEPILLQQYQTRKGNRHMIDQTIPGSNHPKKRNLTRLTTVGSGLVAALLIASVLIAFITYHQSLSSHSSQTASQHQQTQSQTPAPGTIVPGPAASDIKIQQMGTVTIQSINPHGQKATSTLTENYTFHTGQMISVAFVAKPWQNTNGNNTLKWYQNDTLYKQESPGQTSPAPKGDDSMYTAGYTIGMVYPLPGSDKVEIYWGNQLAWTIYFTVK